MGCSLAASLVASLKEFRKQISPDFLFIEPAERVVTSEMRDMLLRGQRDMAFDLGPFITLVEGPDFEFVWEERQPLVVALMTGADLVAVSKSDLMTADRMTDIVTTLQAHCKSVLQLSTHKNLGLKEVIEAIGETS